MDGFPLDASLEALIKWHLSVSGEKIQFAGAPFDKAQEVAIAIGKDAGDVNAKRLLIHSQLNLVVKIAQKMKLKSNASMEELILAGASGLQKVVEKFEYTRGFRLSTYATWWIKQTMTKYDALQPRAQILPQKPASWPNHMVIDSFEKLAHTNIKYSQVSQTTWQMLVEEVASIVGEDFTREYYDMFCQTIAPFLPSGCVLIKYHGLWCGEQSWVVKVE